MKDWQKMAVGVVISLMAWGGNTIYDNLKQMVEENRGSVQALIEIHLKEE